MGTIIALLSSPFYRALAAGGIGLLSLIGAGLYGYNKAAESYRLADKTAELRRELEQERATLELMRRAASDASARAADLATKAAQAEGALDDYRKEVAARPPETKCDLTDADLAALKRLRQGSPKAPAKPAARP